MRRRPFARLLVLDKQDRVLLFKFVFKDGALAGKEFWATPGGAVMDGETFESAAKRELFEETGIEIAEGGEPIAEQEFVLSMPDGEQVIAQEKFFVVRTESSEITNQNQTAEESEVMALHQWWHLAELRSTSETIYPKDLAAILTKATEQVK
jgi:8-oxo-dGTP diphosphatase